MRDQRSAASFALCKGIVYRNTGVKDIVGLEEKGKGDKGSFGSHSVL